MPQDRDEWFYDALYEAIEESDKELDEEEIAGIAEDTIENAGETLYEEVSSELSDVEQYREEIAGFEKRLQEHWGEAFDKLEQLILRSFSIGAEINHTERLEAAQEDDYVFEAVTRLHARASQIAFEILTLLKSGYADAALSRWRSLHEVAVVTLFIIEHGQETAERFLLFENIETYYFAQIYIEYQEELGYEPISDEVLDQLEETKDKLVDRFGDVYDDKYGPGWALHVFDNESGGTRRLEKEVGLQHHRPFYKLANYSVHATPKGTMDRVGVLDLPDEGLERPDVLPAGPTNAGFRDPAVLTVASLEQVTSALAMLKPSIHRAVDGYVNQKLAEDLKQIFAEKTDELAEKEREAREEWANMEIPEIARLSVGFENLLTEDFIGENTEFDGVEMFKEEVPLDLDSLDDLNDEDSEEFEEFISDYTDFESVDEIAEAAFEIWAVEAVDTSEFDFEG